MRKKLKLIDVTLRDAHQSLWATRMTTAQMRDLAPLLDSAGFEAIDLVGGAVFDVCVRFLHENPFERIRILRSWLPKTPLIVHTRGQSLFTFDFFADDIVELAAKRFVANGARYHTPYDALNDIRNLEVPIKAAKGEGLHTVPGLVFTSSPVHTDEYYARKAEQLVAFGVDGVFIKDPSGLLTPERVATLVPRLKQVCGRLSLQLHMHCMTGLAPYVALQAVSYGIDVVHTATSTIAHGASHPSTERFVDNCRRRGFDVDIDLEPIMAAAEQLAFIAARERRPVGAPVDYDEFHFHHQMPGGMVSNLKVQLSSMGLLDRLDEILEEAGHVRADLGYPIVVSPFAQYIVTQAILNIVSGERYNVIPDEVRRYLLGGYGEIAGMVNGNLLDRATKGQQPVKERPGSLLPPAIKRLRQERGPFRSDDDLLLAAFYSEKDLEPLRSAGAISLDYPVRTSPLVTLVKKALAKPETKSFIFMDP